MPLHNCNTAPEESPPGRWRPPTKYVIADADRTKYTKHFIHLPVRRWLEGETLSRLWSMGEGVSSVLIALMIHRHPPSGEAWTPGIDLEAERIRTLAGQRHRPIVVTSLGALRDAGYIRWKARAHPQDGRFRLRTYYISAELYARAGEKPYVSIDGNLIYSRAPDAWAAMPSNAHRHVALAQRLLAKVQNLPAFLDSLPPGDTEAAVARVRRRITVRELAATSGLSVGAVHKVRT
jgi:hypothetical protein